MKIYVARSRDIPRGKKIAVPEIHIAGQESLPGLMIVHPDDLRRALFAVSEQGYTVESVLSHFDPTYREEVFDVYSQRANECAATDEC